MDLLHEIVVAQGLQIEFGAVLGPLGHKLPLILVAGASRTNAVRFHGRKSLRLLRSCQGVGGFTLPALLVLLRLLKRPQRLLQIRTDVVVRQFHRFLVDHRTLPIKDPGGAVTHA
jgi:hypothetical protein